MGLSLQEQLASLPPLERQEVLEEMTAIERTVLASWQGMSRPEQRPPAGDWTYWALIGGRGSGKTRSAAEWVCDRIEHGARYVGFIGRTAGDVRRVMIEGESGFIVCAERRGFVILFNPSRAQMTVTTPKGHEAVITLFSADEPDSLRGPQHDTLWADEFAAWQRKADGVGNTALTNAKAGLRLGLHPKGCFTTTPRPTPEVKEVLNDDTGLWVATRMTTWDNASNLAPGFIDTLQKQYEGTRLAAQEFEGLLVEEVEGALWSLAGLDATRIMPGREMADGRVERIPQLVHRAVGVDPSIAEKGEGDECGIISGGVGGDRRMYVTGDWSLSGSPDDWARRAIQAYHTTQAQWIVAEGNQGGAMVSTIIHLIDPDIPVDIVYARDAKRARAEPVSQMWEEGRQQASMVGRFPHLEEQLTTWSRMDDTSPDRLDAMVWLGHWCIPRMLYLPAGFAERRKRVLPNLLRTPQGPMPVRPRG